MDKRAFMGLPYPMVSTAAVMPPAWIKRESGENPERCRHCVPELRAYPLGNREGRGSDEGSQDTCLHEICAGDPRGSAVHSSL